MKDKKRYCITINLPDGVHYFAGIGEMDLPGTTQKVKGLVWTPSKDEAESQAGVFNSPKEAHYFNKKYVRKDNPKSKVIVFRNAKNKKNEHKEKRISENKNNAQQGK